MSNLTVKGNTSGTGTIILESPNTNTNRTITLPDATATLATTADSITQTQLATALNASGSAPMFACRAWVNFNGTNGAIRGSGNVSSVTYNGTGQSTVNFTTAMPDVNYSAVCSGHSTGFIRQSIAMPSSAGYATGSVVILYGNTINGLAENLTHVTVAVFR